MSSERPISVSLIQLIANPGSYEGKLVEITGFLELEFEGDSVYLHREDWEYQIYSNALWLNVGHCSDVKGGDLTRGYAVITGRFTAKSHGHMGLWPGEIAVKNCGAWPPIHRGNGS